MKALQLARPTLPSISSSAPRKTHLPASQHHHDELVPLPTSTTGLAMGNFEQRRVHLVEEDPSQVETRPRFTCHVV